MNQHLSARIGQAVEIARWAPSSHNCQPWRLLPISRSTGERYVKEQGKAGKTAWVVLALDRSRELKALPSLETEMYLSCGMFLGLFWEAMVAQGVDCRVGWPRQDWLEGELGELEDDLGLTPLVVLALEPQGETDSVVLSRLHEAALNRRTLRGPYDSEALPQDTLERLLATRWPSTITGNSLNITIEQEPTWVARTANLVRRYASRDFSRYRVWRETYRYIHFDESASAEDGFYLSNLMGPVSDQRRNLMRWLLNPKVVQVLRFVGVPRLMARQLAGKVEHSPQLLTASLPGEEQSPRSLVQAGTRLMELWLQAHACGLAFHPISVLLQYDDSRHDLQEILAPTERIVFFARLGKGAPPAGRNPRRKVTDITTIPPGFPIRGGDDDEWEESPTPGETTGEPHADTR